MRACFVLLVVVGVVTEAPVSAQPVTGFLATPLSAGDDLGDSSPPLGETASPLGETRPPLRNTMLHLGDISQRLGDTSSPQEDTALLLGKTSKILRDVGVGGSKDGLALPTLPAPQDPTADLLGPNCGEECDTDAVLPGQTARPAGKRTKRGAQEFTDITDDVISKGTEILTFLRNIVKTIGPLIKRRHDAPGFDSDQKIHLRAY